MLLCVEVQWCSSEVGQIVSSPRDLGGRFFSLQPSNVQWDEEARRRGTWLQHTVAFSHWTNILLFALVLNHSSAPPISGGNAFLCWFVSTAFPFFRRYLGGATGENMPSFHEAVVAVPLKYSFWNLREKNVFYRSKFRSRTFPIWEVALSLVAWHYFSLALFSQMEICSSFLHLLKP